MRRIAAVVCALAANAALAQARRVAVIGVSLDATPQAEAELGAHALSTYVQSDARFDYVSPAVQARDDGPVREAKGLEAKRLIAEAREDLDNLQVAKALAASEKAIKMAEAADLSLGIETLLDATAVHAFAAFAKGDKAGFTNDAQKILTIAPDYAWDSGRLSPPAQALLEPVQRRARQAPAAAVSVASSVPGAWAYVDGTFRGVTPTTASGLRPGAHYVTLVANGYELSQERVFAGSGSVETFSLRRAERGQLLLSQIAVARTALEKKDTSSVGGSLSRLLSADELLIAGVRTTAGKSEAVLARVLADGTVIGQIEHGLAGGAADWTAAGKDLLSRDAPAPKRDEPTAGGLSGETTVDRHASRRPLGWGAAAVAVAALGGGIGLGLAAKSRVQDANAVPQVDTSTYDRFAKQARVEAGVADSLFVLSTVATAGAIWLLATGYASSEEGVDSAVPPLSLAPLPGGGGWVGVGGRF